MSMIKNYLMPNSAVIRINYIKNRILKNPSYQRNGGIWNLEKQQLLIDSILNDYDIPKIYFHSLSTNSNTSTTDFDYAIIDGRQRLEAIWDFMNDGFALAKDFQFLADSKTNAANLTYSELAQQYPQLRILFDSFTLPIVIVETDDLELVEDMFSRLNEAMPLNSAEKRNALGGDLSKVIKDLSSHQFFQSKVKFGNARFQHQEVVARLLFIEYSYIKHNKILDTKKQYLDKMVTEYFENPNKQPISATDLFNIVNETLNHIYNIFSDKDDLLKTISIVPIYYLTLQNHVYKSTSEIHNLLCEFNQKILDNRQLAKNDSENIDFSLLEYERLMQQGTNDATSIRTKAEILNNFLKINRSDKILNV